MQKIKLLKGNRKLSKNILIWNLPRLITCPGAGACKKWCYEIKLERMYKTARPSRMRNLRASKRNDFVDSMIYYLTKRKERIIRVHESGDFYNQEYLDKWYLISEALPYIKFYAYTKSFHLDLWTKKPSNFNIIQSYGSKWDTKINYSYPTNRAIEKDAVKPKNEYECPFSLIRNQGCGETCKVCMNSSKRIHIYGRIH